MVRKCPKCSEPMKELDGQYALLDGADIPGFGSRTEIMVTPKNTLRLRAWRCTNPACLYLELYGV